MLRAPEAGADQFEPLMREALRLQNEATQRALKPPDTSRYAQAGYDREMRGMDDMAAAMAMSTAVPQFHNIAQQTHQAGLESQRPMQMGEGMYMPGTGYVADPFKQQDRLTRAIATQAGAASQFASAYGGQEDRRLQRVHQQQVFDEQRRHSRVMEGNAAANLAIARQNAEIGKIIQLENADGSKTAYKVTPTGLIPLQAQGQVLTRALPGTPEAFPATANPRASDDEKKTTFMLNSIIAKAKHLDPQHARPGFLEAAGRFLPGEYGNVAGNMFSSAERQSTRASQEGIVDSLLTLSTGLSYTPMQLAAERANYLPNYTDKPGTDAIKRQKLADMVVAARARAGRAWTADHERALQLVFPELAAGYTPPTTAPAAAPKINPGAYGWNP